MEIRQEPAILNFGSIDILTGEVWRSGDDIAFVTAISAIFSKSFRLPNDLCVSPKYLSEICKTQSGRSALEWIKEYAIMDITRMMTTTDLSIKQIAFELKYPNLPFFGKCVRRWFGLSPTELRKKLRSG